MCFVVAKHADKPGSVAIQMRHGEHPVAFKKGITERVGFPELQLVTISRPSAYGEYVPYKIVDTEQDFEHAVSMMVK